MVLAKEWRDSLRDRRTLLTLLLSAVLMGPLMLVLLSAFEDDLSRRAESRELLVDGLDAAPTLRNYLERQNRVLRAATADAEAAITARRLGQALLRVPAGFEAGLAAGRVPPLAVVYSSQDLRSQGHARSVERLLQGFNQEQAVLRLALRGVPPSALQAVAVDEMDLADGAARGLPLTRMVPVFVLMAVLYGCLTAALDATAGERERGSLEPLLLTPVPRGALVLGKWAAAAGLGMAVAVLACIGFLPAQWLLRSETLAALFHFGPLQALQFLLLLLPLAAMAAALLMAIALRSRSVKEAQAGGTVLVLVLALLPMLALVDQGAERAWQLWLPGLAQSTLMLRVLQDAAWVPADLLPPLLSAFALTAVALLDVVRQLRGSALA